MKNKTIKLNNVIGCPYKKYKINVCSVLPSGFKIKPTLGVMVYFKNKEDEKERYVDFIDHNQIRKWNNILQGKKTYEPIIVVKSN